MNAARSSAPPKVSPLYDPRWRSAIFQILLCLVIVWLAYAAVTNAADNLAKQRIASGFGFWDSTAGFDISQTLIPYTTRSTYGRAFWVGLAEYAAGVHSRDHLRDRDRLCDRRPAIVEERAGGAAGGGLCRDHPQPAAAAAIAWTHRIITLARRTDRDTRSVSLSCAIPTMPSPWRRPCSCRSPSAQAGARGHLHRRCGPPCCSYKIRLEDGRSACADAQAARAP